MERVDAACPARGRHSSSRACGRRTFISSIIIITIYTIPNSLSFLDEPKEGLPWPQIVRVRRCDEPDSEHGPGDDPEFSRRLKVAC